MFDLPKQQPVNEVSATQLQAMLEAGRAIVVDVREPDEFEAGHIAGAINLPLSRFDPSQLPDTEGRTVVLNCAGGRRSASALDACVRAQSAVDTHLSGGAAAWREAGLPLVSGR